MDVKRFMANYRYAPEKEEKVSFDEFVASTPDEILEQVFDVANAENILLYHKPVMWKMIRFADTLRKQKDDFWQTVGTDESKVDSGCFFCTNGIVWDFDAKTFKTVRLGKCECKGGFAKPSQFVQDVATAGGYDCVRAASIPPILLLFAKSEHNPSGTASLCFKDAAEREQWEKQTVDALINHYGGTP